MDDMANNHVFLNGEEIIEIVTEGSQTVASIEHMGREVDNLITEQKASGKPALILDNLLQLGPVEADGRKLVVELAKQLDYDRAAMLGKGGIMRLGTNLMLRAVGKSYKLRYFDDRAKAVAWLKES
jgi:hypothetical protein